MARTTPTLVAGILRANPDIDLDPFITAASALVDGIDERTDAPSDERLQLIETWLSAHFYCILDMRRVRERAGDVSADYMSKVDLGLNVTHYGQQAMLLDPTGYLKSLNNSKGVRRRVGVTWLGRDCET